MLPDKKLPILDEWHTPNILKQFNYKNWKDSIINLHDPDKNKNLNSNFY